MTTNLDLARQVAAHVVLHSVTLRNAHIESKLDPMNVPPQVGMTQGYRSNFLLEELDGRRKLTILADFKFSAKEVAVPDGDGQGGDPPDIVTLDATFQLFYSLPLDLEVDDECFKHFAELNGPYNAWPYWRELVQSVTGRVGLAGITIPVYRPRSIEIGGKVEPKEKKKTTKSNK